MSAALDGVRVLDISAGVAGGYCTRLLADLGADIVKAETPGRGDRLRHAGPFGGGLPHRETSIPHLHLNAGKRGITLDAGTASGADLVTQLLGRSDVLVIGDTTRLPRALPLSAFERRYPELVVATLTSSGLPPGAAGTGRVAERPSADIVELALSGYLLMTGDRDREPVKPYGEQARFQAGVHAALGILAALAARDRLDAGGQRVDVAAVEAAAFLVGGAIQRQYVFGRDAIRDGSRTIGMAQNFLYPSTIRPCEGGYVHAHVHNRFPELLATLMREPRLTDPDLLASARGRADEIDGLMHGWLRARDKWTAVREAQELRVPFTEVLDPSEVVDDRFGQHAARGFFRAVAHPVAGEVVQLGPAIRMGSDRTGPPPRAPLLGEHNVEVYADELGLSLRDLGRLSAAGAI